MKEPDIKSEGGEQWDSKLHSRRKVATKTKERDNNQLPMMFSEV